MRLSESRSAFTRGSFYLSSHYCGLLMSKGLCCKHILFPKGSFDNRRGLQFSLQAKRGHLELSEWLLQTAAELAFGSDLSGCSLI